MQAISALLKSGCAPAERMAVHAARDARHGRNDACTCGSGRKWKHCHGAGRPDERVFHMSWALLFRARQHLKESFWFYPVIGAILGPLMALLSQQADTSVTVPAAWRYAPSTASAVLTTIVGAMVGLTGFVVTVTVLAIQMATGTFSARYMRIWYRDPLLKAVLTVLIGTLTFSFSLLRHVGSKQVPNIGVSVAGVLVALSLVVFLLFFDRFIHGLRPVAVANVVGQIARRTVRSLTPAEAKTAPAGIAAGDPVLVVSSRGDGAIQGVDVRGLVTWASKHDRLLALRAAVGDFVITGQPVIAVFGGTVPDNTSRRLLGMIALGVERTFEQDPAFSIRIMADVAVKALSAAINDPTSAVQTLDHLENVLRLIGSAPVHERLTFRDREGTPRLVMPGRTWEDYLTLAVTEIREYGSSAIQVMRRLRAMLEALRESVRPEYRPAVDAELTRLVATVATGFAGSVDKDLTSAGDRQGIGGPAERQGTS
jgi:uncharacterized membrane protein